MTADHTQNRPEDIHFAVRERYARAAKETGCGCGTQATDGCCGPADEAVALSAVAQLYQAPDATELPSEVTDLSLGCGDPVTLASLQPGQVVLDLGSGGGIDCFLAGRRVGEHGRVIGVDMTPQMIERAQENKVQLGADNVEFRLGEIEHLPVQDASVDVVISNCVINLSPDKPQVFREAFRVLRPGGRLAVSDIVTDGPLPEAIKRDLSAWAGCVAGAWDAADYIGAMAQAGFTEILLTPVYFSQAMRREAADQLAQAVGLEIDDDQIGRSVFSAKVSAIKP